MLKNPQPLPQPEIHGILFDAEGVVIDTEPIWDESQKQFLSRRGISYERTKLKPLLSGRTLAEGCAIMQSLYSYPGRIEDHIEERRKLMLNLMSTQTSFIEGFQPFWEEIRAHYKAALATAMDVELFDIVDRRLGLRALFQGNVSTLRDVQFRSKPNPDLFLYAANKLGLPSNRCAVIEDAPLGIKGALNAGMLAVGLTTTYEAGLLSEAHWICSSFKEIAANLRSLRL